MQKISTVQASKNEIFKGHNLTIGLDLGDRSSYCCTLDEAGRVILELHLPTTPEAMKQAFGAMPSGEGEMPRSEPWLRWLETWRYCSIGCG